MSEKRDVPKFRSAEGLAAIAIFGAVVLAGIFRLFMGISVADEAEYAAFADFPRHGLRFFEVEVTIQQTSAILLSPFVLAYTSMFGTEGLILFSRFLYLISATTTGLITAKFLSQVVRWPVALLLGSVVVAYVPFGMAILCYITMGSQYFAIAAIASISAFDRNKKWLAAAGGVFWVLCVFAYPTAMITFALFTAILALWFRTDKKRRTLALPYLAGLVVPSIILVGVLLWCGIDNIKRGVEFSAPANMPFQTYKILFGINLIASYLPPVWMMALGVAIWGALWKWKPDLQYLGIAALIAAYIFFGGQSESSFGSILWVYLMLLLPLAVIPKWKKMSTKERTMFVAFTVPAIVGSIVAWMTSRMTVYNMHGTGIFAGLSMLAFVAGRGRAQGWLLSLIVLSATLFYQFRGPYEDAGYPYLTYQVSDGPFKFLYTNPKKGEVIETLQRDLKSLPDTGTIFFKDHFPAGAMMTNLKPKGPTINLLPAFIHPEMRGIYAETFRDRGLFTDYIVEFRYFPMSGENWIYMDEDLDNPKSQLFQWDPFHNFFMKSGEYDVILDRGVYRILKRKS
jgi:hypothetical protein